MAKAPDAEAPSPDRRRKWHRLFGLLLTEHLAGSPFIVELEKDLSRRQQLLDVVVVRRGLGKLKRPLPDGLDNLVEYNLITFKSFREALDDWTLKELTGHYVNYRKQVSERGALLPERAFGLYAICARTPRELFQVVAPETVQPGVYVCRRGSDSIRIIVAAELPKTENNALLHLFSAADDQIQYGAEHYDLPSSDVSTIVNQLFAAYRQEGLTMPYTMKDFRKEVALEVLDELTPEQRLAGLKLEQIEAYLRRLRKGPKGGRTKKRKPKR